MLRTKVNAIAQTVPTTTAEYGGLDYETMSADQLEAENNRLTALRDAIRQEQKNLTAALDATLINQRVSEKLAALSDQERAALMTQLVAGAGRIESGEKFSG